MATRGTSKRFSQDHEDAVAKAYGGRRSPSSGASVSDPGDVITPFAMIECKMTGHPGTNPRTPVIVQRMEKIFGEATEAGRDPVLALRYYAPSSRLADQEGWVDLAVRRLQDDAEREAFIESANAIH